MEPDYSKLESVIQFLGEQERKLNLMLDQLRQDYERITGEPIDNSEDIEFTTDNN